MNDSEKTLAEKRQHLEDILSSLGKVAVAFSGGVDSTLLLKIAGNVLSENVIAITALSETTSAQEHEAAIHLARRFGIKHLTVESHDLDLPDFVKNYPDRCYVCKKNRFKTMIALAHQEGMAWVVDGENVDDQQDYRPGIQASRELGVRSPLSEAGLTKADIRLLSRMMGLSTWNKPSAACLASRIPYYRKITAGKLKQIENGEAFLRRQGLLLQIRVRHEGDTARIELAEEEIHALMDHKVRNEVVAYFNTLGFKYVAVDLKGYRMGSLNRSLTDPGTD